MAKPKHIILTEDGVITQEALLAYAQGRLGPEEVAKLEKLLRDDPFAQEALEGIRAATAPAQMASVVTSLNVQLREKTGAREKKKKGIEIHWATYAYAAVIVGILIGLGFVMVHFIADNEQRLAMNKTNPQAQESVPVTEGKPLPPAPDTTQTVQAPPPPVTDSVPVQVVTNGATSSAAGASNLTTDADKSDKASKPLASPAAAAAPATKSDATKNNAPASKGDEPKKRAESEQVLMEKKKDKKDEQVTTYKAAAADEAGMKPAASNLRSAETTSAKKAASADVVVVPTDKLKAARILFDGNDFKSASKLYNEVLSDQPENADALYFGGICEYHNGKNRQAEKSFDKLLKASLYVDGSKWYKANVLIERGKKEEARQLLRDLINTNSSFKDRAVKKYEEIVK